MANRMLRHGGLSIPMPTGWEDRSEIIILGPSHRGFRVNLVYSRESLTAAETAAEFAARQLMQLKMVLTNYVVVRQHEATFGENVGYLREQTFHTDGESPPLADASQMAIIRQLQFHVVEGLEVHTLTFTDLDANLDQTRAIAERLFAKTRLPEPEADDGWPVDGEDDGF